MCVLMTLTKVPVLLVAPVWLTLMPAFEKLKMLQFSTLSFRPDVMLMPFRPSVVPAPLIERLRRMTEMVLGEAVALSLTLTPLTPLARIEPKPAPFVPSMVMFFVMVMAPNPPGSSASISPPAAVFEMAPAKVLQGAVRLQGLTSSPTPETHVLVAWACATAERAKMMVRSAKIFRGVLLLIISLVSLLSGQIWDGWKRRRGLPAPAKDGAG